MRWKDIFKKKQDKKDKEKLEYKKKTKEKFFDAGFGTGPGNEYKFMAFFTEQAMMILYCLRYVANYLTQAHILASQSRENVNAAMAGSGDQVKEEEDERSCTYSSCRTISFISHPYEGTVPYDIDIIQESVAMVTTPTDVIRLPQHTTYMSAPTTYNNRRQTEIRDRRQVPRVRPNHQLQLDEQPATSYENKMITLVYGLQ
nr:hypothetical protein [Tanacetum cinerariifolium]